MIDLITPFFLLMFISMILSTIAGARPETMAKTFIDLFVSLITLFFKVTSEMIKAIALLIQALRPANSGRDGEERIPRNPFPDRPRPRIKRRWRR